MHRTIAAVIALAICLAFTATAHGGVRSEYLETWKQVAKEEVGPYDGYAGRNLVRQGVQTKNGTRPPKKTELRESIEVMERMLNPAPAPVAEPTYTEPATTTSTTSTGGYSIPESIVMCESGGNYNAVNPSSGAYGAYQIMPGTAAAHGCDLSTPAGQDSCAAEIWATQGRGAWVC